MATDKSHQDARIQELEKLLKTRTDGPRVSEGECQRAFDQMGDADAYLEWLESLFSVGDRRQGNSDRRSNAEGYPGIAHDMETLRTQRGELAAALHDAAEKLERASGNIQRWMTLLDVTEPAVVKIMNTDISYFQAQAGKARAVLAKVPA